MSRRCELGSWSGVLWMHLLVGISIVPWASTGRRHHSPMAALHRRWYFTGGARWRSHLLVRDSTQPGWARSRLPGVDPRAGASRRGATTLRQTAVTFASLVACLASGVSDGLSPQSSGVDVSSRSSRDPPPPWEQCCEESILCSYLCHSGGISPPQRLSLSYT